MWGRRFGLLGGGGLGAIAAGGAAEALEEDAGMARASWGKHAEEQAEGGSIAAGVRDELLGERDARRGEQEDAVVMQCAAGGGGWKSGQPRVSAERWVVK